MPDVFLRPGAASSTDVTLRDPTSGGGTTGSLATTLGAGGVSAAGNVGISAVLAVTLGEVTLGATGTASAAASPWKLGRASGRSAGRLLSSYSIAA